MPSVGELEKHKAQPSDLRIKQTRTLSPVFHGTISLKGLSLINY